jgi:hypothetical protein
MKLNFFINVVIFKKYFDQIVLATLENLQDGGKCANAPYTCFWTAVVNSQLTAQVGPLQAHRIRGGHKVKFL